MKELVSNIIEWSTERGIPTNSTAVDQKVRMVGELTNEFLDAYTKGFAKEEQMKELGDVYVFAINWLYLGGLTEEEIVQEFGTECLGEYSSSLVELIDYFLMDVYTYNGLMMFAYLAEICEFIGSTPEECLQAAWEKIKDREGKTVNGKFVAENK